MYLALVDHPLLFPVLRSQVGGRFVLPWSVFRASQIQQHGLWCQVRALDNAGMGSDIGDFYYPTGDGPDGFTLVPTSASNSAPYVSLKCTNQMGVVVDGDLTNNQGFVKCNSTIPNLDRDANYWVVYSDTVYENYSEFIVRMHVHVYMFKMFYFVSVGFLCMF